MHILYITKPAYASKICSNFICNCIIIKRDRKNERIKKFWEELISYLNLIRLRTHRKLKIVVGDLQTLIEQGDLRSILTKIKDGYRDRR
jgi:hypothetical protein